MNSIRQIKELNKRELEIGVSPTASWHADYRDTAYIYIGGLPFELSEGDIITIFSQFGEPTFVNLVRDKETGKSKGFAFLKYEDQRSTDLAVDNLGGATVLDRIIRVDHTRYKKKEENAESRHLNARDIHAEVIENKNALEEKSVADDDSEFEKPILKEELELATLLRDHDNDDPMKPFLIQEKKEQVLAALRAMKDSKASDLEVGSKRHHKHHHRLHKPRRSRDLYEREDSRRNHKRHE